MPIVFKYCPRCIKEARTSALYGIFVSLSSYYFWDYLGHSIWILFVLFLFLRYTGMLRPSVQ